MNRFPWIGFLLLLSACGAERSVFEAGWPADLNRIWVGADFWANRLQDWRIASGRLECLEGAEGLPLRTLHVLTRRIGVSRGEVRLQMRSGALGESGTDPEAAFGFLIGVGGNMDYRSAALIQSAPGEGAGLFVGLRADGVLFLANLSRGFEPIMESGPGLEPDAEVSLDIRIEPDGYDYRLMARAVDGNGRREDLVVEGVPADLLEGGIAVGSHRSRRWFDRIRLSGSKLVTCAECALGSVLSTQYTVSRGILKMTAQLMPVDENEGASAVLQVKNSDEWESIATAEVIVPGWTATFRVTSWNSDRDVPYRVTYQGNRSGFDSGPNHWEGLIRRDPVDQPVVAVAGFTGNHNVGHGFGNPGFDFTNRIWFPHSDIVSAVRRQKVDLLFFSGDQVYEGGSPTPADRRDTERATLDYLYKWYLWCWAFRDLTKDIPTITIPDDHDVFQGNLWGAGGRPASVDHNGGYVMPAEWVQMVERTQTSHLPDPVDPDPVEQGIGVYFTTLTWGRIGIAVLEDRKFKSGCAELRPGYTGRPDHVTRLPYDPGALDPPGLSLLGDRQERFLGDWVADWSGHDMKLAVSQSAFAGLATHHGAGLERIYADLDSNGWPRSGRRRALEILRKGFAFHLGGDQHLSTLAHHGLDAFEDAGYSFVVPSIANFYPRAWNPETPGLNRSEGDPPWLGRHMDGLGNRVTVYAVTNPTTSTGISTDREPLELHDNMPGYGIVRFDKQARAITVENWPRHADPATPAAGGQYEGWPKTIPAEANYGRIASAFLPVIQSIGMTDPVIQVLSSSGDLVYALRVAGTSFRPKVFEPGLYTVQIGDPDRGGFVTLTDLRAGASATDTLRVTLPQEP
jgi:alkaline phosphatase D